MAGETPITLIGRLVRDVELTFTPTGVAVAKFTVASNPRKYNSDTKQWEDQDGLFLNCEVWRDYAENVAESLSKGSHVIVQGRLKQRSYENRQGEKRTVYEVDVEEVGPALRFARATVTRAGGQGAGWARDQKPATQQNDPWAGADDGSAPF